MSPPAPQPIPILLDDGAGDDQPDQGDSSWMRVHENQIPTALWHDGQPMPPPAKPPSRRAQSEVACGRRCEDCDERFD
jgi:hypothetical protein